MSEDIKIDSEADDKTANTEEPKEREVIYCDVCGAGPVAFQEGCFLCLSCGASKCS